MVSVLASIRPYWSKKIFNRSKGVELRKSHPKAAAGGPFKVYLYESRPGAGAVVGEFICWFVEKGERRPWSNTLVDGSTLVQEEITEYAKGKAVYGWHITRPVYYTEPIPLERFGLYRPPQSWCYVKGT